MSRGSGILRWLVGVTTGAVEKILGLAFLEGMLELGAVEEPDAIVDVKVEDEVKNKLFAKFAESLYSIRKFEGKVA